MSQPFRKILCAVDLGPNSEHAVALAKQVGSGEAEEIALMHVVPLPVEAVGQPIVVEPLSGAEHDAREALTKLAADIGIRAETVAVTGDPASEIIRTALERGAIWWLWRRAAAPASVIC